jgi:putative ABC transport system permease protein
MSRRLAGVGVYSVISYTVVQRTHEFGIRMALGAGRNDILRIITAYGLRLAALGLGAGLAGAFVLARLASSFLYSVRPTDPWAFLLGSAALLAVVLLASHLPARRATRVDPMVALRQE